MNENLTSVHVGMLNPYFKKFAVGATALAMLGFFSTSASASESRAALFGSILSETNPSLVDALTDELSNAGYTVEWLSLADLCDQERLVVNNFDLLVVLDATSLPIKTKESIEPFLKAGGDIIALRAPLWGNALIEEKGRWVTYEQTQLGNAGLLPENIVFDFTRSDLAGWSHESADEHVPVSYEVIKDEGAPGGRALHTLMWKFDSTDHHFEEYMVSPQPQKGVPDDHDLLVFSAKGGADTPELLLELEDRDGATWSVVIPLYPQWRRYVFSPGKQLNLGNIKQLKIGLQVDKTGYYADKTEYWMGPVGTAKTNPGYEKVLSISEPHNRPILDTLSPRYKLFESHGVSSLEPRTDQAVIGREQAYEIPGRVRSPHPRPKGSGFDKGREWRWMPLVEARAGNGQWRGTPVTLLAHFDGLFKGGLWASFGIQDADWYQTPAALKTIGQIAKRMKKGVFMLDGGTGFYTYFEGQPVEFGIRVANLGKDAQNDLKARITMHDAETGREVFQKEWAVNADSTDLQTYSGTWQPTDWPPGGFEVRAEIIDKGKTIDRLVHQVDMWKPKTDKQFVTVENGGFILNGKRWRPNGINYMPSSGVAMEDGYYFEHWLSKKAYDPEIIDRDLKIGKGMGFNSLAIFLHEESVDSLNLLDILRRMENLGLKCNLALRTPLPQTKIGFAWDVHKTLIENYQLPENDTIFAYDIAWEMLFDPHGGLKRWDAQWQQWIMDRYGSIENAEKDWNYPVPRDESGKVTAARVEHLYKRGEWFRMTAAYRRFLDTLLYKEYSQIINRIKKVDSNHLVSFRMYEAGSPSFRWEKYMIYQLPYLAAAVDIIEPEAYGRIGNWDCIKQGRFMFEYDRWVNPELPVMWAETGVSAWGHGRQGTPETLLQYQADYFRDFYLMLIDSGSDGVFHWYYPGGYRCGENSDYGVINPDGTDRSVTKVIRQFSEEFINGPEAKPVDLWIQIDRDAHPDSVAGIYKVVKDDFWKAIYFGKTPGLRTLGTGTDSTDCPMLAVGNSPCNGANPPKYLDAVFDSFEIENAEGKWVAVESGDHVQVDPAHPVVARIKLRNLGEAKWIAPGSAGAGRAGEVHVVSKGKSVVETALPRSVDHLGSVEVARIGLAPAGLDEPTEIVVSLAAKGRSGFGEKFRITISP